jgi:hypothetical protein
MKGRAEIQAAPDDTARAIQEARHRTLETRLRDVRLMGDAVIGAFFSADKPKERERHRADVESWLTGSLEAAWGKLAAMAATLQQGEHPLPPFHWEIEFPEVFAPTNGGFDAIVGNPPFAGKNTIAASQRRGYAAWLQTLHKGAHGNADLVAHFFLRSFASIRSEGVFGLIATKTISQGDTRATGLSAILASGGVIFRAIRRLKWPGEAAVTVAVVHIKRGPIANPQLDGRIVRRISAYLVDGDLDGSLEALSANKGNAFKGSELGGDAFLCDDSAASLDNAHSMQDVRMAIELNPSSSKRVIPYLGGEDLNTSPTQTPRRSVIWLGDLSLAEAQSKYPELTALVHQRTPPKKLAASWWRWRRETPELYRRLRSMKRVIVRSLTSAHFPTFSVVETNRIFEQTLIVFLYDTHSVLSTLCSAAHEIWVGFLGATLEDRGRYSISDSFEPFPFPSGFEMSPALEAAGQIYNDHRSALMIARNEGLTKIYNQFHDRNETAEGIKRLRILHAAMDRAVLESYGWGDLAERAVPIFLDESNEDDHTYQGRLFWPSELRDEVLARLLALNAERHAEEVRLGTAPGMKVEKQGDDEEYEEE